MKMILMFLILIFSLPLFSYSQQNRTREQWEDYFKENLASLDPIEGLWIATTTPTMIDINTGRQLGGDQTASNIFAIIKRSVSYEAICVENILPWTISFEKSANPKKYFYKETVRDSRVSVNTNAIFSEPGEMEFDFYYSDEYKQKLFPDSPPAFNRTIRMHVKSNWVKSYPFQSDIKKTLPSSGTGFAISKDGIIATNYHVVENGKSIIVKGVNGDFNRSFKAVTLVADKTNDIVLIKIDDPSFTEIKSIPYTIKRELSSVGEEVFVMGYPLRASMGDEIKLTNGIISSKTGYQGDITTYQISAPVQPGNSGGPLFSKGGDLIGIVNAKHIGAENVSYAIKSNYIFGLIELLDTPPQLTKESSLTQKSLAEQVRVVKDYIFIIEVN